MTEACARKTVPLSRGSVEEGGRFVPLSRGTAEERQRRCRGITKPLAGSQARRPPSLASSLVPPEGRTDFLWSLPSKQRIEVSRGTVEECGRFVPLSRGTAEERQRRCRGITKPTVLVPAPGSQARRPPSLAGSFVPPEGRTDFLWSLPSEQRIEVSRGTVEECGRFVPLSRGTAEERQRRCRGIAKPLAGWQAPLAHCVRLSPLKGGP